MSPWGLFPVSGIKPVSVTKAESCAGVSSHALWFLGTEMLLAPPALFQVTDGRGNCTPHRNPTPCTIPQDKESIFHSIFAFFTKSGRRVVVNIQPSCCTLTPQGSLTVTLCGDSWFFFSQRDICLSHFCLPQTLLCSVPHFIEGL